MKIGFLGLLGLLFIGLKLGGAIDWPWWWVLAPLWGPLALAGVFFGLAGLAHLVSERRVRLLAKKRGRS